MKLRDLEATFLKVLDGDSSLYIGDLSEGADGIMFLCPKCFRDNGGSIGTHSVICWFVGVDPARSPGPGRWTPSGRSIDDLTFIPSPGRTQSVELMSGCRWHGHVVAGDVSIL